MDSNFAIIFSAVFISNIVLSQFLGICSFLGVSKSLRNALGMSAAVAFVMVLASLISWLVYYLFLAPYDLTYLKTIVFILAIASLVQLVEMFIKKMLPALHIASPEARDACRCRAHASPEWPNALPAPMPTASCHTPTAPSCSCLPDSAERHRAE